MNRNRRPYKHGFELLIREDISVLLIHLLELGPKSVLDFIYNLCSSFGLAEGYQLLDRLVKRLSANRISEEITRWEDNGLSRIKCC
jgi:hypothetical protein